MAAFDQVNQCRKLPEISIISGPTVPNSVTLVSQ